MSSEISYTRAAQVCAFAVAAAYFPPAGVADTALTFAKGMLGAGVIWSVKKSIDFYYQFAVYPDRSFSLSMKISDSAIIQSIERVEGLNIFNHFKNDFKLTTDEEVLTFFRNRMQPGLCYGKTSTVLNTPNKDNLSLKERLSLLKLEECVYRQMLNILSAHLGKRVYESGKPNPDNNYFRIYDKKQLRQIDEEKGELESLDPCLFIKSKTFALNGNDFPTLLNSVARCKEGFVVLPKHCILFQSKPEYALYDSASSPSLFNYPDEEAFKEGMELRIRSFFIKQELDPSIKNVAYFHL